MYNHLHGYSRATINKPNKLEKTKHGKNVANTNIRKFQTEAES